MELWNYDIIHEEIHGSSITTLRARRITSIEQGFICTGEQVSTPPPSLSVCPWVWRPEIKIRSLLQLLSTLFIYFSVAPAFTSLGRLSSQWAPENLLSLPTKRQDYRCVPQSWRLTWVLGIGFRSSCVLSINYFMVWTTSTLSQPPAQHFILKGENTIFNLLFYAHVEVRTQLLVVRSPWDPGIKTQVTKFVQKMCSPAEPSSCKCII